MTATDLVLRELEPEHQKNTQAVAWLRDVFQVVDDESMASAGKLLVEAKTRIRAMEERRTSLVAPFLASKRAIDELFKPMVRTLEEAERTLKAKMGQFISVREEQRRALMAASAAQYQAGLAPVEAIPQPASAPNVTSRTVWDFEVTDPAAVPRDLCTVDERLIRARIPADGAPSPIPGVRWFQREHLTVRTRT